MNKRASFDRWFSSKPTPHNPTTKDNKPEVFVIEFPPNYQLDGTWSVQAISVITPEVDFTKTNGDLMVYTDLIDPALVGHGYFPLIDRVVYSGQTELRHQESKHPFIRKVKNNYIQTIGFKIGDGNGKLPVWSKSGRDTLICLRFKPEPSNFDQHMMDLTFVSNQSKHLYPNNSATKFTAQLPSYQRYDDPKWKVGLTKVTLPPITSQIIRASWSVMITTLSYESGVWFTIENVSSFSSLMSKFNPKADIGINDYQPSPPFTTDDIKVELYKPDPSDSTSQILHDTITFSTNTPSFQEVYDAFKAKGLYFSNQPSPNNDKLRLMYKFNTPGLPNGIVPKGNFFKFLGFAGYTAQANEIPANSGNYYYQYDASDPPVYRFGPAGPPMDECRLYEKNGKPYLKISCLPYQHPAGSRTVVLPEGMCSMLGFKTDGAEFLSGDNGSRLVRYAVGKFENGQYANVGVDADGDVAVGLDAPSPFGYVKALPSYYQLILEGDMTKLTESINPQSGFVEIKDFTTHVAYSKVARVKCDLIKPEFVGDKAIPLLDIVPLTSASAGDQKQPKQYVFEPQHYKGYPLIKNSFQSITFEIEDEDGELLPFVSNGIATITLRFKK